MWSIRHLEAGLGMGRVTRISLDSKCAIKACDLLTREETLPTASSNAILKRMHVDKISPRVHFSVPMPDMTGWLVNIKSMNIKSTIGTRANVPLALRKS